MKNLKEVPFKKRSLFYPGEQIEFIGRDCWGPNQVLPGVFLRYIETGFCVVKQSRPVENERIVLLSFVRRPVLFTDSPKKPPVSNTCFVTNPVGPKCRWCPGVIARQNPDEIEIVFVMNSGKLIATTASPDLVIDYDEYKFLI
jgi:hypothetical protein